MPLNLRFITIYATLSLKPFSIPKTKFASCSKIALYYIK